MFAIGLRARGLGCSPLSRAKPLFFGQMANFLAKASSRHEKRYFMYLLKEKTESIRPATRELPEIRFLLIIIGWGESGKTFLNETLLSTI